MENSADSDASWDELNLFISDIDSSNAKNITSNYNPPLNDPTISISDEFISVSKRKISRAEMTNSEKAQDHKISNYRNKWKQLISNLDKLEDPWSDFPKLEVEEVKRYRYRECNHKWTIDIIKVQMENKSFSAGSMRECFRLKFLSNFTKCTDWNKARNCVAKRYFDFANLETYKNDVVMQAVAKEWSEIYNKSETPKKIDMVQLNVIEFINRNDNQIYHLESFIEGKYEKYNSNCGFVSSSMRNTPHAFSHFTFEKSGHELMVVDIQGVDDMYTDPQIHTYEGDLFGEGNLGIRGMALFFQSHCCSSICSSLGLKPFDLTEFELNHNKTNFITTPQTIPNLHSTDSVKSCGPVDESRLCSEKSTDKEKTSISDSTFKGSFIPRKSKICKLSECSTVGDDSEINLIADKKDVKTSVLSNIHHQIALYHQMGRFLGSTTVVDWRAFDFHENMAAKLNHPEALENLAKIYLDLTNVDFSLAKIISNEKKIVDVKKLGVTYLIRCAEMYKSPFCLRYAAHCLLEGSGDFELREKDFARAKEYLEELITCGDAEYYASTLKHLFREKADLAKIYRTGGFGLEACCKRAGELYNEAANDALRINCTQMAMNYFAMAEECELEE